MQRHGSRPTNRRFTLNRILFTMVLSVAAAAGPQQDLLAQDMPEEPPYAMDDWGFTESHTSVVIDVLANDYGMSAPIDAASVTILLPTETGSTDLDPHTGLILFTPDPGESVNDCLIYKVFDLEGRESNPAFLWITVMHEPPVASDDWAMTVYTASIESDVLENDTPGTAAIDAGTVQIVTPPQYGDVQVDSATGRITYVPAQPSPGADSYEYVVEDIDGVPSNIARVDVIVENQAPMIDWFYGWMDSAGTWVFEGELTDEVPETVTVELGGLLDATVAPDSSGYFRHTVDLPPQAFGNVTATATDETGLESNTESTSVYQY